MRGILKCIYTKILMNNHNLKKTDLNLEFKLWQNIWKIYVAVIVSRMFHLRGILLDL